MSAAAPSKPVNVLVTLAFAGVCAALLARGVIIILLAPTLAAVPASGAGKTSSVRPRDHARRNLTVSFPQLAPEIPEEDLAAGAAAIEETAAPTGGPLVPLQAEVVGITWYTEPTWSLANLVVKGDRTVHSVNACDDSRRACSAVAEGYRLVEIQKDKVFLLHEASGQRQELELNPKEKMPEVAAAPAAAAAPVASHGKGSAISKMMDNVKQVGPNHWEAPPGMRDDVLGRLSEVAMEGRWMPYFEGGKITGFKLAQTAPNSAFDKIGLKSGDVIKSVNGYDISSPDKMLDVFTKLRDARDISVDVQRADKQKSTLKYTIN